MESNEKLNVRNSFYVLKSKQILSTDMNMFIDVSVQLTIACGFFVLRQQNSKNCK